MFRPGAAFSANTSRLCGASHGSRHLHLFGPEGEVVDTTSTYVQWAWGPVFLDRRDSKQIRLTIRPGRSYMTFHPIRYSLDRNLAKILTKAGRNSSRSPRSTRPFIVGLKLRIGPVFAGDVCKQFVTIPRSNSQSPINFEGNVAHV